jgi:hypothetical protein
LAFRLPRLLACLAAAAAGCGPIAATNVIDDAEVALARAHASDGDKYAAYETTLADLYLAKAKEEQGHAHYSDAMALASDAVKYASTAAKKAIERRNSASTPPAPTAKIERPSEPSQPQPGRGPAPASGPGPAPGPAPGSGPAPATPGPGPAPEPVPSPDAAPKKP